MNDDTFGQRQGWLRFFHEAYRPKALLATRLWVAAGLVVVILVPRLAPIVVVCATVAPVIWNLAETGAKPSLRLCSWSTVMFFAGLFLALNASWSPEVPQAYTFVLIYFVLFVSLLVTLNALAILPNDALMAMASGLVLGWSVAVLALSAEYALGGAIQRLIKEAWTGTIFSNWASKSKWDLS